MGWMVLDSWISPPRAVIVVKGGGLVTDRLDVLDKRFSLKILSSNVGISWLNSITYTFLILNLEYQILSINRVIGNTIKIHKIPTKSAVLYFSFNSFTAMQVIRILYRIQEHIRFS